MALMSEKSQEVNVHTAGGGQGQGKKSASFEAHFKNFLMTLCRLYDTECTRNEVSAYQRWLSWSDARDSQCTLTCSQAAG